MQSQMAGLLTIKERTCWIRRLREAEEAEILRAGLNGFRFNALRLSQIQKTTRAASACRIGRLLLGLACDQPATLRIHYHLFLKLIRPGASGPRLRLGLELEFALFNANWSL
jgi:hypothetical protein